MMPDMSDVLEDWAQPVTLKTVTTETVDFEPTETVVASEIDAVVQVADTEKIKVNNIDYSKEYILIHSVSNIAMGDFVEWLDGSYLIVSRKNYSQYGYVECVGEEVI